MSDSKIREPEGVQYSVRPVVRYIVTRYEEGENGKTRNMGKGEYDNADVAYEVGYALCRAEHEKLGWPLDDGRIKYPLHPERRYMLVDLLEQEATSTKTAVEGSEDMNHGEFAEANSHMFETDLERSKRLARENKHLL